MTKPKPAEIVREQLGLIYVRDEGLTPRAVVEAARPPKSPLHGFFEWDNKQAGERYRLAQARTLIRTVTITMSTHNMILSAPAYTRDAGKEAQEQGYRAVMDLRDDPEAAKAAMQYELDQIVGHFSKLESKARVLGLVEMLAEVRKGLDDLRQLVA